MNRVRAALRAGLVMSVVLPGLAEDAPAPRSSWLVAAIYGYNHPYAGQAAGELATKMQKMSASPFAFYRGTAHVFYADMTSWPGTAYRSAATARTWLSGDMHLANIGAQRDAKGNDVFDLSDFDDACIGPYEWDVRRLAVSIVLAARENGMSDSAAFDLVRKFVDDYVEQLRAFKGNDSEQSFSLKAGSTSGVVKDTITAAAGKTRSSLLSQYTTVTSGVRRLKAASDLVGVSAATANAVGAALPAYVQSIPSSKRYASGYYALKDVRQKLGSGTGSLGRLRYYLLLEGPTSAQSDDVIVEMKQEAASAVAIAAPGCAPASPDGERAARSMRALLTNADVLSGQATFGGRTYFLREKSPYQEDFDTTRLDTADKFDTAMGYVGKALAKAHAVSDKDFDPAVVPYSQDKEITAVSDGFLAELKVETAEFALEYADQVELDFEAFVNAYFGGTPLY